MRASSRLTPDQAAAAARNLKRFREEWKKAAGYEVGQDVVADFSGIPIDTYRSYENGKRRVSLGAIYLLSKFYDRPIEDFLTDNPPPRADGWRPPARTRFMALGLDADLEAGARNAADEAREKQLDRLLAAKEKMRRGRKL